MNPPARRATIAPVVCHCGSACIEPGLYAQELLGAGFALTEIVVWSAGYCELAPYALAVTLRGRRN